MAFSPFARYRNFTVSNLKALLEVYPDVADSLTWNEAINEVEEIAPGYKRTAYQQACQFGIEDRGSSTFKVHSYLYTFDDYNLRKYIEYWIKVYYAPNPYVNSNDEPMLIYCELAKEILGTTSKEIDFYDFFNRRIAGKSDDILMNALKEYAKPIKYRKDGTKHVFYVEKENEEYLRNQIDFIESNYPITNTYSQSIFFERFSYANFCKFYGIVQEDVTDSLTQNVNDSNERVKGATNVLLYGVPGAGKSHAIKDRYCSNPKYMERVVFHPDYTYSDFVGQILPRVEKDDTGADKLRYVFVPGPFTRLLKKAWNNPDKYYYLVVEELNRGNAPAIFGEVFQLLDRNDDGESEYGIANYDVAKEVFEDVNHEIKVPSNMYILATMNTADQNVFTLDTAFQRRWDMEQIPNNITKAGHADERIEGSNVTWAAFAGVVNDMLVEGNQEIASSEDKRLGAFFVKKKDLGVKRFSEKVIKYLWDDAFKMDKTVLFNDSLRSLEEVIAKYAETDEDRLKAVLNNDVYSKMQEKVAEFRLTEAL